MITTSSVLPAPVQQSFNQKLLAVPVPDLIHKIPAMLLKMPRNGGRVLRSRRYNALPTATVPLGNSGLHPPAVQLSAVDIDAQISFYGQYIYLNEQVTLQSQDKPLNEAGIRLGVSMRTTEDELMRDMLLASASFINCVNGTNGDNPTDITRPDVDLVVKALKAADGKFLSAGIMGEDRIGTSPIRDSYMALASTDLIGELEQVDGFIAKYNYPRPNEALVPEWCSIGNLRVLLSSVGSVSANSSLLGNDVRNVFVCAMDAFAAVEQDGYSNEFIYRPPIYDGPLALNASAGYKFADAPHISNDAWVANLRCTAKA